jgi:hypothetical protein
MNLILFTADDVGVTSSDTGTGADPEIQSGISTVLVRVNIAGDGAKTV